MSVRTKKHPTDAVCTLAFVGPVDHAAAAREALHALGFEEAPETVPWRECFPAWSDAQFPGVALAGARHKEGLTQVQLARLTGIPSATSPRWNTVSGQSGRTGPRSSRRS